MTIIVQNGKRLPVNADRVYVDPENGDDSNDGLTSGTALETIQAAIDLHIPYNVTPYWDTATVKYVTVIHTPAMGPITENVIKPAHLGDGQLIIEAELESVNAGLVQSGAKTAIAGFFGVQRVTFTTSPLTASTLSDGYFLKTTDEIAASGAGNASFLPSEHSCIVDNATNSVDVPFTGSDGFGFVDTASVEIVRPQIVWDNSPLGANGFGPVPHQIVNQGGMLIVKGFIFNGDNRTVQADRQTIAHGLDQNASGAGCANTTVTLCRIEGMHNFMSNCSYVQYSGCFIEDASASIVCTGGRGLSIQRSVLVTSSGEIQLNGFSDLSISGCFWERRGGATNKLQALKCSNFTVFRVDTRGNMDLRMTGTTFSVRDFSCEDAGDSCIRALDGSVGDVGATAGTSGNLAYGLQIGDLSKVERTGVSQTMDGALGEILVGSTVHSWAGGDLVDATSVYRG